MGWRFRRSIRLFPGLRLNLSKSGVSMTAGIRGLSVTTGKRGTYLNAGLPGSGLYSRQKIGAVSNVCKHAAPINDGLLTCACGYNNPPAANYCSNCGKKLEKKS
jgi:hypothetical protein